MRVDCYHELRVAIRTHMALTDRQAEQWCAQTERTCSAFRDDTVYRPMRSDANSVQQMKRNDACSITAIKVTRYIVYDQRTPGR
jgi:hypothetical protein